MQHVLAQRHNLCRSSANIAWHSITFSPAATRGKLQQADARQRHWQREKGTNNQVHILAGTAYYFTAAAGMCVQCLSSPGGSWCMVSPQQNVKSPKKHSPNHGLLLQLMKVFKSIEDKYNYMICILLRRHLWLCKAYIFWSTWKSNSPRLLLH